MPGCRCYAAAWGAFSNAIPNRTQVPTPCQRQLPHFIAACPCHRRQAAEVLVTQLLPLVLQRLPPAQRVEFTVHIVGANIVPERLRQLFADNSAHVTFHGHLSDQEVAWSVGSVSRLQVHGVAHTGSLGLPALEIQRNKWLPSGLPALCS